MTKKTVSLRQNGSLLRGPMRTQDSLLKTGRILHAEPVPKVLAAGVTWTGNAKPEVDCERIADSFLKALGTYTPEERARIVAAVTKSGTPGFEASGAGIGTPIADALRHLDSARAGDMRNIASMTAANKALAAKLGGGSAQ